ncbi:calcium-binding protein [Desulfovibrio mangrovi]|uniref:calcium-binding protein n=1 Tax=Desulfovibrio mangrovi TaxID=2976983 RepID=UPI0022457C9F|nr:calcium-binding protein [Desulfovibrio mangrovi]UZP68897.1 calcium-binding protein [Desulfovibrio mangrovi]
MKRLVLAALITCLWTSPGFADDKFGKMDKDGNDSVSWEEFEAHHPNMRKAAFETIDKDSDGAISHDEWHAFMGSHGADGKAMGGGMGQGMQMPPKGGKGMPPGHPPTGKDGGKMLIEPPKKAE